MVHRTSATGGFLRQTSEPPAHERLEDVWHDVIVGITGLGAKLVRPTHQVDPAAIPPVRTNWCAFRLEMDGARNFAGHVHDGSGEGQDIVVDHMPWRVTAFFYGPDAEDLAGELRRGLEVAQNRSPLRRCGCAVTSVEALVSVPELDGDIWCRRADLVIHMTATMMSTYNVLNIKDARGVVEDAGRVFTTEELRINS
ncbi:MAG: phage neck terminator protein [Pyramidobacter sp.]|jgi:hypothetical protein